MSITGNPQTPRFQHLVAGTYKKWANENGKYFSVASGSSTDAPCTPTIWRRPRLLRAYRFQEGMHGDAQFAGSSSVPAHVG